MTRTLPLVDLGNCAALPLAPAHAGRAAPGIRELSAAELLLVGGGGPNVDATEAYLRDLANAAIATGAGAAALGAVPLGAFLAGFGAGLYFALAIC